MIPYTKMAVTEFALIPLKPGYDKHALHEALLGVVQIQDTWVTKHQPSNLRPGCHASVFYVDRNRLPSPLCITAAWPSPDGHWDWCKSEGNKECNDALTEFNNANESMMLFHMIPAVGDGQLQDADLQGDINVHRLSVPGDSKEELQMTYVNLLQEIGETSKLWAGWRIEESGPDTEELVLFSTDAVTEQQLQPLLAIAENVQTHQLHQIV